MDEVKNFLDKIFSNNIISSAIVIVISIVIYELIRKLIFKKSRINSKMSNRNKTYLKLFSSILRYAFLIITILIVLKINGVNVDSILAGAGIVGIVIGFAVQDALKDLIRGMTILTDAYYSVGDVVQYGDIMGKVISIGLSTTKIQDIRTFNIVSIANRNIEQIQVVSDSVDIFVPLSYELPINKAEIIMDKIVEEVKELPDVKEVAYKGISAFKDSNMDYYLNVHCEPELRRIVTRRVNCTIIRVLEKNKIEIPYNQLDIHQK